MPSARPRQLNGGKVLPNIGMPASWAVVMIRSYWWMSWDESSVAFAVLPAACMMSYIEIESMMYLLTT